MGGFNPANGLAGATETQALPQRPGEIAPFYPRIWQTGSLEQDIRAIAGNVMYYTSGHTTVTVVQNIWYGGEGNYVGTETGQLGYVQQGYNALAGNTLTVSPSFRAPTEAEREAWAREPTEAEREAWARETETHAERQRAADATAQALLESCLDAVQLAQWNELKSFIVETNGRRYRLGLAQSVTRINGEGRSIFNYCIHTPGVPRCDEILSHKLLLEADESLFLRTANATITEHGRRAVPNDFAGRVATPVHPDVQRQVAA